MIIEGLVGILWAFIGIWMLILPLRIVRSVFRTLLGVK